MTLSRAAVASRLPRPLIKTVSRFALILIGSLLMTAPVAVAQRASSRPVARMVISGQIPNAPVRQRVVSNSSSRTVYTPAAPTAPAPAVSKSAASLERRAFDLANAQRRSRGQQPLAWDAELSRLARQHSENMARSDFFSHSNPRGMSMVDRARSQGIRGWSALGENIAYNQGYEDPAGFVIERWMVSSKHRDNLLNARWTRSAIGVAVADDGRVFFTQVFIAP
jgi:uncharacterized protein YkwD